MRGINDDKLQISDFMDVKILQKIQDKFADATGLAAITVGSNGEYITEGSNFTDFCIKYTRGSSEGLKRCVKCDNECTGTYYCHAGLMDFSNDIVVNGIKLGAVIGGQVLPCNPDEKEFRKLANDFKINEAEYIDALKKVPIREEKNIKAAAELLGIMVNEVVTAEYLKWINNRKLVKLSKQMDDIANIVSTVLKNTQKLDSFASQQNMLALNARIESARAGELGKGFAIVANEVANLSEKSKDIYKDIDEGVKKISQITHYLNDFYNEM